MKTNNTVKILLSNEEINVLADIFQLYIVPDRNCELSQVVKNIKYTEAYKFYLDSSNKDYSEINKKNIIKLLETHCKSYDNNALNALCFITDYYRCDYYNLFTINKFNKNETLFQNSNNYKSKERGIKKIEFESEDKEDVKIKKKRLTFYSPRSGAINKENIFINQLSSIVNRHNACTNINISNFYVNSIDIEIILDSLPLNVNSSMFPDHLKNNIQEKIIDSIQKLIDENFTIDLKTNQIIGKKIQKEDYEHNYKDQFILKIIYGLKRLNLKFKVKKKNIGFTYFLFEILSLIRWEPSYNHAKEKYGKDAERFYLEFVKKRYRLINNKKQNILKKDKQK
ncbi:MAG: hypothetical protein U0T07_09755 [Chitinophagales bacterium]